jgi:hypothetical protein
MYTEEEADHDGLVTREVEAMKVLGVIAQARDAKTVKLVFGEPFARDAVTLILAARVRGGRSPRDTRSDEALHQLADRT